MGMIRTLRAVVRIRRRERDRVARRLRSAANVDDLRSIARRRLPAGVFDYIDGGAEDTLERSDRGRESSNDGIVGNAESIDSLDQSMRQCRRLRLVQQRAAHPREGPCIPRKPSRGIRAWRLRHHAAQIEPPVRGSNAVEPTEARRYAYRPASVGTDREMGIA